MVRYFYAWTPLVIVGTIFLVALPWLGLIALMLVTITVLPALALAILFAPYMLVRAIVRHSHRVQPQALALPSPDAHRPVGTAA